MLFGKKESVAGLDIGSSAVKMVELDGKWDDLKLRSFGFENLPADTVVDGQIMELNAVSEVIQSISNNHQIRANHVVTGVSGHSVIIKNIMLPPMSRDEVSESIDWHAEEHIPFDLADVNLDYHINSENRDGLSVMIAACKSERIENIRQAIQLAGKIPMIIDIDTFALQNCYEVNYQPGSNDVVTLLNIGASTMNINIVRGTDSIFTRDITFGGNQFTDVIHRTLGISFQQAEAVKRGVRESLGEVDEAQITPLMDRVTETVAMELQKTFDFYRTLTTDNAINVQKIFISGGGSKLANLPQQLSERFGIPVEVLNPFRRIDVDAKNFDPDYLKEIMPEMAVAIGLALRGVEAK